ncbi:Casparian strip membrane protein [Sesbania bispinosa]|nr:Casparian strip membrane protein [Sesbania bispinosa]
MGTESKPSVDELSSSVQSDVKKVVVERPYDVFLRFLCLSLTLIATIIVGADKETKTISYAGMQFTATAKWEYMSAIVFFLVSNAIGCSYAAVSLVISAMARSNSTGNNIKTAAFFMLTVLDLVMMALLFSANGAAGAVGVLGQKGNSHVQWMKVCNVFDAYCRHVTAALVLSIIGSSVFLLLVVHSVFKLHYTKNSN